MRSICARLGIMVGREGWGWNAVEGDRVITASFCSPLSLKIGLRFSSGSDSGHASG